MTNLKIGDAAPDFSLEINEGDLVGKKDYAGKFLVLYFYPKDDTPGCTVEAQDFNELLSEFVDNEAAVIGVSKDSKESHDKFCRKYDLKFALGYDAEQKTCNSYGVIGEKSMFGKKYIGVNRSSFLIDKQGKIAHIWPQVSVNGHAKEVLGKIKQLRGSN